MGVHQCKVHFKTFHPASKEGSSAAKRQRVAESARETTMFDAGMMAAARMPGGTSPTKGVAKHFSLSPNTEDLTFAARFYVYGRQRISKQTFTDEYFKDALRGSNKNRPLLTPKMLEKYVQAEFSIFVIFLKHFVNKKLIQTMGNPFAQAVHDGVTLGDHNGYESMGLDMVDTEWEGNHPICIGFKMKPKREDGSFDGSDVAIGALFSDTVRERTGHGLSEVVAAMKSDGAATGVARALGLEPSGCLMHDIDKLPSSGVGALVRRDMTKPVVRGHRPYANSFPAGR